MPTWEAKGKARAVAQAEGPGGTEGIVLPLQVAGTGVYDIAYTIEVSVGSGGQQFSLQVDTGSSDLWIASKSCSSSICGQTNGHSYDPTGAMSTGVQFDISYLQGNVSGPIVWDQVDVGGYSIDNQALAAADTVSSEPLSPLFSGILGLALPLNSIIAHNIAPVTDNSPDGAAWASNLFSITPVSSAPAARFLSLSLSRPGSNAVPAQLGIGRHPSFVSDPSKVRYSSLVSDHQGTLFWKVGVRAITVWVNGEEKPVELGRSATGSVFPSAVLDSGVPLIFTTSQVANGIYGAIGISPGHDGNYYVPCTTPLNLTITLDDRPPLPLHPLDLTAEPPKDNQAAFCIGLIQPAPVLARADSGIGDMILGVPFLRNVYTVMAYSPPAADGSFSPPPPDPGPGPSPSTVISSPFHSPSHPALAASQDVLPRLGLLGLTDPTVALDEFKRVRVLNQPISPGGSNSGAPSTTSSGSGKRLSVGIIVLIGLLGFFALCMTLFGVRWWLVRRRYRRAPMGAGSASGSAATILGLGGRRAGEKEGGYALAARGSRDLGVMGGKGGRKMSVRSMNMGVGLAGEGGEPPEDVLRTLRYEAYMQDHGLADLGLGKKVSPDGEGEEMEMGYRRRPSQGEDSWDPRTALAREEEGEGWGDETLVAGRGVPGVGVGEYVVPVRAHERSLSAGVPLLHEINLDHVHEPEPEAGHGRPPRSIDEFGMQSWGMGEEGDEEGGGMRTSMAGVGTAARGGKIGIGVAGWNPDGSTLGRPQGGDGR